MSAAPEFGQPTDMYQADLEGKSVWRKLTPFTERTFLLLSVVLGLLHGWAGRYSMNPDGMAYLDIAQAYVHGNWSKTINAYWSPLYSFLLGIVLGILKPPMSHEFAVAHFANFLIFVLALICFRYFLRSVLQHIRESSMLLPSHGLASLPEWILVALGYSIFLWSSLELITLWDVSPDLLLSALVYLLGGVLIRLRLKATYPRFLLLGLILGAAYTTKAVMFPLAFAFLTIALFSGVEIRARLPGVLLASLVFLAVSTPWVIALSRAKGRFMFGDSGKLTYAWCVSPGSLWRNWQGQPASSGVPRHPTRQLLVHPPLFEFSEPVGGTYPPWFDPSYWNDGTQWRFSPRAQSKVLLNSALFFLRLFLRAQAGLLTGVIVFLLLGRREALRGMAVVWPVAAAALVGMAIYAPVLAETRYVGGFLVLLWCAILAAIRLPDSLDHVRFARYVGIAMVITILLSAAETTYRATEAAPYSAREDIDVAANLQHLGLHAGDKVAVIGDGTGAYWAHLGQFKIVAEIMSGGKVEFWSAPDETKAAVYQAFRKTGALAIITWDPPCCGVGSEWHSVLGTRYYAYFLEPGPEPAHTP
jgi:hypothetical protein